MSKTNKWETHPCFRFPMYQASYFTQPLELCEEGSLEFTAPMVVSFEWLEELVEALKWERPKVVKRAKVSDARTNMNWVMMVLFDDTWAIQLGQQSQHALTIGSKTYLDEFPIIFFDQMLSGLDVVVVSLCWMSIQRAEQILRKFAGLSGWSANFPSSCFPSSSTAS